MVDGKKRDVRSEIFPTEGLWDDDIESSQEESQSDQGLVVEVCMIVFCHYSLTDHIQAQAKEIQVLTRERDQLLERVRQLEEREREFLERGLGQHQLMEQKMGLKALTQPITRSEENVDQSFCPGQVLKEKERERQHPR